MGISARLENQKWFCLGFFLVWEMLRVSSCKITEQLTVMWILESPFYKVLKKPTQPTKQKVQLKEAKNNDER